MSIKHYVYQITDNITKCYYIGVRSSVVEPHNDKYMGSGNWIKSHQKEYGKFLKRCKGRFNKTILEICESRELAFDLERRLVSEYFNDPYCMNICGGGIGVGCGKTSPRYKSETKRFWDHKTQKDFHATVWQLTNEYGVSSDGNASELFNGNRRSSNGIVLYENKNKPYGRLYEGEMNSNYKSDIKRFWNHTTNSDFYATKLQLRNEYGIKSEVSDLFSGKRKYVKGIVLYENKDRPLHHNAKIQG